MSGSGADRRTEFRHAVVGSCDLLLIDGGPPRPISMPLLNVSRGGISLASADPLPVGTLLKVRSLVVRGQTWLLGADARIVWARGKNPDLPHEPAAVGLCFVALTTAGHAVIERLLKIVG